MRKKKVELSEDVALCIQRIIEEKKNQWNYNHPGEEFIGVETKELREELARRLGPNRMKARF